MQTDYPWMLTEMAGPDGTMTTPITIPTLAFEDGSASGNASCNQYFGSYEIDGLSLTFGPLASTEMFCGEPGVMDQETQYLAALQQAAMYRVDAMMLEIFDADDTRLVQYQRAATP